jgi:hypothetical protein
VSEQQFIKPPWKVSFQEDEDGHVIRMGTALDRKERGHQVQHVVRYNHGLYPEDGEQWDEAVAIANLIAAAPALLEIVSWAVADAERAASPTARFPKYHEAKQALAACETGGES